MGYKFDTEKHVHILDGAPLYGTSTIVKEVMPPFLAKWGAQCAADYIRAKFGSETHIDIPANKFSDILTESVSAWSKVRKDAATKGTDMHKDLEDYVQMCIDSFDGTPQVGEAYTGQVGKFAEWANANVQQFIFAEKYTYSKELHIGGIVDCLAKLRTGELAVIDFKSSKEVYFNHLVQIGGYALQLEENGYCEADGSMPSTQIKIDALIVVPFGSKDLKPLKVTNVEGFKETFKHLVEVYKLKLAFEKR